MRAPCAPDPRCSSAPASSPSIPPGGGIFWVPLQYAARPAGARPRRVLARGRCGRRATSSARAASSPRFVASGRRPAWPSTPRWSTSRTTSATSRPGARSSIGGPADLGRAARDGVLLNLANSVPAPLRDGFAPARALRRRPGHVPALGARVGHGGREPRRLPHHRQEPGRAGLARCRSTACRGAGVADRASAGSWPAQPRPAAARATPRSRSGGTRTGRVPRRRDATTATSARASCRVARRCPQRAGVTLELAANLHADETDDRALLAQPRLAARRPGGGRRDARPTSALRAGVARRVELRPSRRTSKARAGMDQRSHGLLPGERAAVRGRGDGRGARTCRRARACASSRRLDEAVEPPSRAVEARLRGGVARRARARGGGLLRTRSCCPACCRRRRELSAARYGSHDVARVAPRARAW